MIYKIGSRGDYVRKIQQLVGAEVDGVYGPATADAVKDWQRKMNLSADGVWGPQTQQATDNFFTFLGSQQAPVTTGPVPAPAPVASAPAPGPAPAVEQQQPTPPAQAPAPAPQPAPVPAPAPAQQPAVYGGEVFRVGSTGPYVRQIQKLVGAPEDDVYTFETAEYVRRWQESVGTGADGIWGPQTQKATEDFFNFIGGQTGQAPTTPSPSPAPVPIAPVMPTPATPPQGPVYDNRIYGQGSTGDYVRRIQQLVGATVDGVYGPDTARAVANWQRSLGIQADGIWGPATQQASEGFFNWLGAQQPPAPTAPGQPGAPTVPGVPERTPSGEERDAMAQLRSWLSNFGLENLAEKSWDFIVKNGIDQSQLRMWIYEQPEFHARFPAMRSLQAKQRAISPEEYISRERQYKQVMQNAGVLTQFFDSPDDFTSLFENEIDPDIFEMRVNDGFQRVANAPQTVRQAFSNYFGIAGDSALAAYFIDPQRATPAILQAAKAAQIGGAALDYNVSVSLDYASRLANMGVSYEQALQGMQRVSQMRNLFETGAREVPVVAAATRPQTVSGAQVTSGIPLQETGEETVTIMPVGPSETGLPEDMRIPEAGAEFVFGTNPELREQYERRLAQRLAAGRGEGTDVVTTRTGRTSLG